MIYGILIPKLLRLNQIPLILRMAIQCAEELQINPVFSVKSSFLSIASIETIVRFIDLRASELMTSFTLKDLNGIVSIHGHVTTLLFHKFEKIICHSLFGHEFMFFSIEL